MWGKKKGRKLEKIEGTLRVCLCSNSKNDNDGDLRVKS